LTVHIPAQIVETTPGFSQPIATTLDAPPTCDRWRAEPEQAAHA
jgi:hypothetical protein